MCIPVFLQHLHTFAIEKKAGLLTVEDSIRKLKLLDARGKIWTQEVCLRVDEVSIKMLDSESQVSYF